GKIDEVQTQFQHIEMYDTSSFGKLMIIDGCTMVSTRDNFLYHEMMTHPVLFTHQNPKKVLIIGGGDCGTLREVLKHLGVEKAWQVDIDEQVTRMSEKYFPELCESNEDSRAELLFEDGIKWIQDAEAGSLDLIIVDSTDPVGPAEGLFTEAFYRDCIRALHDDGLLIQQSESPLLHLELLKAMQKAMEDAGFEATKTLYFPQPLYPSGWWSATMAGKQALLNGFREEDSRNKTFKTTYYNVDIHRAALAQPEFCKEAGLG
ncbi:polyamine aminopropyltransferase, partial [Pseudomonadota bacterium]